MAAARQKEINASMAVVATRTLTAGRAEFCPAVLDGLEAMRSVGAEKTFV